MINVNDVPRIRGKETWELAADENHRFAEAVRVLGPDDWGRPTDCDGWNVRDLCVHILGALEAQASPRVLAHQFRRGLPLNRTLPNKAHWVDGINEFQIRERATLSVEEIVQRIARMAPAAVRGRRRTPPPVRWLPMPLGPPMGWKPLTYLLRVGFTRDVWMHRIDLTRASGQELVVTPGHDGRIVADLVREWAGTHGQPFTLTLEGAGGGAFRQGDGGESVRLDAIEFARILSGRSHAAGVMQHKLPL